MTLSAQPTTTGAPQRHRGSTDEPEPRRRRGPRLFRVGDWKVRTKLGAVLTIPAVAFIAVAGLQTNASVRQAQALQQYTRQVHLSQQITTVVHELQRERDRTAGELGTIMAQPGPAARDAARMTSVLAPDQTAVNRAIVALRTTAGPLLADPGVKVLYDRANASLQRLDRLRGGVQGGWLRQQAAFDSYTRTINDLIGLLPSEAKVGSGGDELGQAVRAVNTLAGVKELTDQMRGRLYLLCTSRQLNEQQLQTFSDLTAQRQALLDQFRDGAPAYQLATYDAMVHGPQVLTAEGLAVTTVTGARAGKLTVDPNQWWQASSAELDLIRQVEQRMITLAMTTADDRNRSQWRGTMTATSVIIVILLVALLTSWVIGRSMARSLRLLREQALDVAEHRLPQMIERLRTERAQPVIDVGPAAVDAADEIGEVAKAFTAVHHSAARLAVEQAMMREAVNAMFVNLARRSQTLVERQLLLLDELESAEADPDQLANLFRLDHLATRMRRNDENLLVLAGADNSRRWSEPVALSAVVLAAIAEIEQYPRIRHDVAEDAYLVGYAVADVVHLLAELLENATTFSPPDTMVNIVGFQSRGGPGAVVQIEDWGLGMSPDGMAEANQRLNTPSSIDLASSERMGLLVVANLAARHQIQVQLGSGERGVRAQVLLPAQLLAPPPLHRATGLYGAPAGRPVPEPARAHQPTPQLAHQPPPQLAPQSAPRAEHGPAPGRPPGTGYDTGTRGVAPVFMRPGAPGPAPAVGPPTGPPTGALAPTGGAHAAPPHRPATPVSGAHRPPTPVAAPPRRTTPTRAEDVLNAASSGSPEPSRWWSRTGAPAVGQRSTPAPPQPVIAGTSAAGLPVRQPLAQLPGEDTAPAQPLGDEPERRTYEPDPSEISSMLSRFYGGVERATADEQTQRIGR